MFKFLIVLLFVSVLCNKAIVDYVNTHNLGWKAYDYPRFRGLSNEELKQFLGLRVRPQMGVIVNDAVPNADPTWDWRTKNPGCDWVIRDQGQCGSCWAFGFAEAIGNRFCIFCKSGSALKLAAQDPVSCDKDNYGCQGGYLDRVWNYCVNTGVVPDNCFPYKSGGGSVPACPTTCPSGTGEWHKYKCQAGTVAQYTGEANIMTEIQNNGPAEFTMAVYPDFFNYKSGIYAHNGGSIVGYHAIQGVGWGADATGKKYWIIANSWGTGWGIAGYFWILKGTNESQIESSVYSAKAAC